MIQEFLINNLRIHENPKEVEKLFIEQIKQATKKVLAERQAEQEIKKIIDWL